MRIGIDTTGILAGGGLHHLSELLRTELDQRLNIELITVWGGNQTLSRLPKQPWLQHVYEPRLDLSPLHRFIWQKVKLPRLASSNCDILFVPGGSYVGLFHPFVSVSQNLLPFLAGERQRYGFSKAYLRLVLLEKVQSLTFRRAEGMIFLTESARRTVEGRTGPLKGKVATIPHGISELFRRGPMEQLPFNKFSLQRPFHWLYVSIVNTYKHQWHVAEAVGILRRQGIPLTLSFVGPAYPPALRRLNTVLRQVDPKKDFIAYNGAVPHEELRSYYHKMDGFIFASSCENMPLILLEAMASSLPIACSNRDPMPEVLGDAGLYFDPEQPSSLAEILLRLMKDHELRRWSAEKGYQRSKDYSWNRCANETFSFLSQVARDFPCSYMRNTPSFG
jgi:glycosyltransferase involved in cell wall biosynthesis